MQPYSQVAKTQDSLSLLLIAALAIVFLPTTGTSDVCDWLGWAQNIADNGLVKGYIVNHHEHPPFFSVLLYLVILLAKITGLAPFYALKISFLAFLLLTLGIIHQWSGRNTEKTLVFFIPLAYSCLALSYMDIYFTPFFLLAIYFTCKEKPAAAAFFFILSALIKSPPLIVAPFIVIYAYSYFLTRYNKVQAAQQFCLRVLLPAAALLLPTYLVFGNEYVEAFSRSFWHNCLSCNALNFNRLLPIMQYNFITDQSMLSALLRQTRLDTSYNASNDLLFVIAKILFFTFYGLTLARFLFVRKSISNLLLFCILGHFSYFTFSKGVHENHLYLSMLLAMCLAIIDKRFNTLALNICLIASLNLFLNYGVNGMPLTLWWDKSFYPNEVPSLSWLNAGYPFDNTLLMSIFNTAYFLVFWLVVMLSRDPPPEKSTPSPITL